jgi:hypothetical protein
MTIDCLDEPADWDVADHKTRRERTDVHRPSVINPADYDYVGQECMKWEGVESSGLILAERERIQRHFAKTGGTYSRHSHGGNCHVCGASAIYTHLFHHRPSNTYVRTGEDCAEKLGASVDGAEFRKACQHALEAQAGKRKAKATLEAANIGAAWDVYVSETLPSPLPYEESTIIDIVGKLVRYGSISGGQAGFIAKLLGRIADRPAIEAARAAERAAAKPFPKSSERQTVRGTIVSIKPAPEYFGGERPRMLVKSVDGWLCFGSLPIALDDAERGAEIEFSAVLKPSPTDPKFGFFSRPTKARNLTAEAKIQLPYSD